MKERERRLLFNDAVDYHDYTASEAEKLNTSMEHQWNDKMATGALGEKPVAVALCPPLTPRGHRIRVPTL